MGKNTLSRQVIDPFMVSHKFVARPMEAYGASRYKT